MNRGTRSKFLNGIISVGWDRLPMAPDASASSTEMDERAFMDSFFGVPRFRASRPEQSSVQLKGDGTTGSRSDSREELAPGALERCDSGDGKQVTVEKAGGEEARTSSADSQGTPSSQARAWDDGLADRLASYIRGLFSHPEVRSDEHHSIAPVVTSTVCREYAAGSLSEGHHHCSI